MSYCIYAAISSCISTSFYDTLLFTSTGVIAGINVCEWNMVTQLFAFTWLLGFCHLLEESVLKIVDFSRLKLLLSGDVEQNPGQTMVYSYFSFGIASLFICQQSYHSAYLSDLIHSWFNDDELEFYDASTLKVIKVRLE